LPREKSTKEKMLLGPESAVHYNIDLKNPENEARGFRP
jgi:hypothetical protein